MIGLRLFSRQQAVSVDLRFLRRIALAAWRQAGLHRPGVDLERGQIEIILVATPEITRLNEQFLAHHGSTDVITFDYGQAEVSGTGREGLQGEIYICVEEATLQSQKHGTDWLTELVRYLIHGLLHLRGFDDAARSARRVMKREENRLVRAMAAQFPLRLIARRKPGTAGLDSKRGPRASP